MSPRERIEIGDRIVRRVANRYGIPLDRFRTKHVAREGRNPKVTQVPEGFYEARRICVVMLRDEGFKWAEIGGFLGIAHNSAIQLYEVERGDATPLTAFERRQIDAEIAAENTRKAGAA